MSLGDSMAWLNFGSQHRSAQSLYKRWFAGSDADTDARRPSEDGFHADAVLDMTGVLRGPPSSASDDEMLRLAALGRMTTGIVHDFGNLLQIATSAIRLMELGMNQSCRSDLKPLMQGALASIARASDLSRQILMFSRKEEPYEEIVFVATVLAGLRGPMTWMLGPEINVEFDLDDNIPGIFCDCREFENAILNLVINAKDAMPDGGNLRIECCCEDDMRDHGMGWMSGRTLVLRVIDNGEGMSEETAKTAFRQNYTTKSRERGNGLGLARVSDFVRRAGGSATIASVIGSGTTVVLRFPVAEDSGASDWAT
jgi:signal transduction histidine kinase